MTDQDVEVGAPAKPLIYVASPITGDPWNCVRRAIDAAHVLDEYGCLAYLPQLNVLHEIVHSEPYEHWIELGLTMVGRCDGLVRLPGDSPGADREWEYAGELGVPRFADHHPNTLHSRIFQWWITDLKVEVQR